MTIAQAATASFKTELAQGTHNFGPVGADVFRVALYTSASDIGSATTVYTTSNEVAGAGYTAGGNTLTISVSPTSANNSSNTPTTYLSFANTSWAAASFTARGALVYNATQGNKAVAVLDFGADKSVNADTFQIIFPTADANSAIVRIS